MLIVLIKINYALEEVETSRDAEGSITNPVEESEGFIQGDGDRTLGDADSSCCEEIGPRPTEVFN